MIQNQTLANQLLETMDMMGQALVEISQELLYGNSNAAFNMYWDLKQLSMQICKIAPVLCKEEPELDLDKTSASVDDSIQRLSCFSDQPEQTLHKIEFETIPLILNMKQRFYFFACVYPDPVKIEKYYSDEMYEMSKNWYLEEAEQTGKYKYEVSIYIIAYNHLDYTKRCVESVLKTIPKDLNYELILCNHGCMDRTKEYFESIHPTKQLDIAVNGGGIQTLHRIVEGKYSIAISNDVIVLENSIQNLLECMKSDPKIAYAVPSTPNISNLQTIPITYRNEEEMYKFAKKNNRYDPYRHEQRSRLCNPIAGYLSNIIANEFCVSGHFYPKRSSSFPDDRMSLWVRRHGYKCVLVKDAFCHHFGSVTLKSEIQKQNEIQYYQQGRKEFEKLFQIDPWGTGFCFDPILMEQIDFSRKTHTEILGLNCGLFSNPLKIREELKAQQHNLDVTLWGITDHKVYHLDQKSLCDNILFVSSKTELEKHLAGRKFHYIVWEDPFQFSASEHKMISFLVDRLENSGVLILNAKRIRQEKLALLSFDWKLITGIQGTKWYVIQKGVA